MENLKDVLDASGARFNNVVKVSKFLTRIAEREEVWVVMKESPRRPSSTSSTGGQRPGGAWDVVKVEVDMTRRSQREDAST